jgi:hypothetical protein
MAEQIINSYSWNIFINTGYIDKKYLVMISDKIRRGMILTEREESVRREYASTIEHILLNTYEKQKGNNHSSKS